LRPYRRLPRPDGSDRSDTNSGARRDQVLAQGVEADVLGRGAQHVRIVLELAQSTVAVEAQQGSDGAGGVIMIDVLCGSSLADRTQPTLSVEQRIGFLRSDAVPASEVICALAADEFLRAAPSGVVTRLAVGRSAGR